MKEIEKQRKEGEVKNERKKEAESRTPVKVYTIRLSISLISFRTSNTVLTGLFLVRDEFFEFNLAAVMEFHVKNKAGYTAAPVACGWAGAVIELTKAFGQEQ